MNKDNGGRTYSEDEYGREPASARTGSAGQIGTASGGMCHRLPRPEGGICVMFTTRTYITMVASPAIWRVGVEGMLSERAQATVREGQLLHVTGVPGEAGHHASSVRSRLRS